MDARRDELLALAKHCEEAAGPDRDIDGAAARALGWTFEKWKGDARPYWRKPGETQYYMREQDGPPRYSTSLDAALSLMLPDVIWDVTSTGTCWIDGAPHGRAGTERWWTGKAATPALALCAASLRARAALVATEKEDDHG